MNISEQKFKTLAKWGIVGLVSLILGPIFFLIAKGILGATLAIVAAAFALFVIGFLNAKAPAVSEWLTQTKFKSFTDQVSRAPIESLYHEHELSWKDLQEARTAVEGQITHVEVMKDNVAEYKKTRANDPESIAKWVARLEQWEKILAFNLELFKGARQKYDEFGRIIEDAEMDWKMSLMDRKLSKAFGKKDDFMRNLRSKTALDTVQQESAAARARLRMSLEDNDYASSQTKDQAPVHAIEYDRDGKIQIGSILNVQPAKAVEVVQQKSA